MSFRACRMCLALDKKLTRIQYKELMSFIKTIFHEKGYLQSVSVKTCVCYECKAFLIKFYNFVQRVTRAHNQFYQLDHFFERINLKMLKDLDRNQLGLDLKLDYKVIEVDYAVYGGIKTEGVSIDEKQSDSVTAPATLAPNVKHECVATVKDEYTLKLSTPPYQVQRDTVQDLCYLNETKSAIEIVIEPYDDQFNETQFTEAGISDTLESKENFKDLKVNIDDDECYVNEIERPDDIGKTPFNDPFSEVACHIKENNDCQPPLANVPSDLNLRDVKILSNNEMTLLKRGRLTKAVNKRYKEPSSESEEENTSKKKPFKQIFRQISTDEDFDIKAARRNQREEESSSEDSFDDNGKRSKRPQQTKEYPRKCDHCKLIIETGKYHYKHYLICHPNVEYPYARNRPLLCEICGHKDATLTEQMQHMRTHGEKSLQCPHCERKYYNTRLLNRHIYRYHKNTLKMFCDYCNKCFKQRQDIILHIRTHTGEKPFKCPVCEARFAHKGNIKIHMRTHQYGGRKPFKYRTKTEPSDTYGTRSNETETYRNETESYESTTKRKKSSGNKSKTKKK